MNSHLSKYLTHESAGLRDWVKSRIPRTDQRYEVIEGNTNYIPKESHYVYGEVNVSSNDLKSLRVKVLYCEALDCFNNQLTSLPELPVCETLHCGNNQLTQLPKLPVCKTLYCRPNQLEYLPELPVCEELDCGSNQLTQLPNLPVCKTLYCRANQLEYLPELPKCEDLSCEDNPGYPFK